MKVVLRAVAYSLLFVAVLIGGVTLTYRVNPFPEVDQLREKWAYWQEHKDEYDTVFIGTSRVYRGIMPSVFDEMTAKAGVPTHSFNFGVDGMLAPEDAYAADYILRHPPKNLRWVFLELGLYSADFEGRDPANARTAHWHDWQRTSLVMRTNLWPKNKKVQWKKWFKGDPGETWPADLAWTHFRLFFDRSLNLGRAAVSLEDWMLRRPVRREPLGPKGDGFFPYEVHLEGEGLRDYQRRLAERQEKPPKDTPLNNYHQESVDSVLNLARKAGAKPALVLAPSLGGQRLRPAAADDLAVFDFYDVKAFPEMFVPEVRADHAHLNTEGALIFTRALAEKFIPVAGGKPAAAAASPAPSTPAPR